MKAGKEEQVVRTNMITLTMTEDEAKQLYHVFINANWSPDLCLSLTSALRSIGIQP